ncbi:MAG TPA: tetratricopeptide repeat protein, partial [Bacteroidia bacterium]|nr:tetratricopeptide repeat protein [Bacteroidia bacterium]
MKRTAVLFLFCIFSNLVFSQTKRITDSLERRFELATSDTAKFNSLVDLINAYRLGNTQKAGEKTQQLLDLSQQMDQPLYKARAVFYLAIQKRKEGNYDTAITLYQQALPVFEQYNDQANEAAADGSLGIMYWQQEDLVLATKY